MTNGDYFRIDWNTFKSDETLVCRDYLNDFWVKNSEIFDWNKEGSITPTNMDIIPESERKTLAPGELQDLHKTPVFLDELSGKYIYIDFWASWCGPCRRENPNVVKVYDKYKADGFTIYSVSLDGLDPRRAGGKTGEALAKANEPYKQRWIKAIEKDQLSWPYHVSELTKWESTAGRTYGVRGIPKTFLIDRDGKIAAVGLRGAASIEQALQKVL